MGLGGAGRGGVGWGSNNALSLTTMNATLPTSLGNSDMFQHVRTMWMNSTLPTSLRTSNSVNDATLGAGRGNNNVFSLTSMNAISMSVQKRGVQS